MLLNGPCPGMWGWDPSLEDLQVGGYKKTGRCKGLPFRSENPDPDPWTMNYPHIPRPKRGMLVFQRWTRPGHQRFYMLISVHIFLKIFTDMLMWISENFKNRYSRQLKPLLISGPGIWTDIGPLYSQIFVNYIHRYSQILTSYLSI